MWLPQLYRTADSVQYVIFTAPPLTPIYCTAATHSSDGSWLRCTAAHKLHKTSHSQPTLRCSTMMYSIRLRRGYPSCRAIEEKSWIVLLERNPVRGHIVYRWDPNAPVAYFEWVSGSSAYFSAEVHLCRTMGSSSVHIYESSKDAKLSAVHVHRRSAT